MKQIAKTKAVDRIAQITGVEIPQQALLDIQVLLPGACMPISFMIFKEPQHESSEVSFPLQRQYHFACFIMVCVDISTPPVKKRICEEWMIISAMAFTPCSGEKNT